MSPSNLRKSLTKIAPQFRGNGQHDSQELLRCLLGRPRGGPEAAAAAVTCHVTPAGEYGDSGGGALRGVAGLYKCECLVQ